MTVKPTTRRIANSDRLAHAEVFFGGVKIGQIFKTVDANAASTRWFSERVDGTQGQFFYRSDAVDDLDRAAVAAGLIEG